MSDNSNTPVATVDLARVRARAKVLARADRDMKDQLISLRRELGLTQAAVAELLGVSPQAVQKFERYDTDPKLSTVRRYANAVGALVEHRVSRDVGQSEVMAARSAWECGSKVRRGLAPTISVSAHDAGWANARRSSFALAG